MCLSTSFVWCWYFEVFQFFAPEITVCFCLRGFNAGLHPNLLESFWNECWIVLFETSWLESDTIKKIWLFWDIDAIKIFFYKCTQKENNNKSTCVPVRVRARRWRIEANMFFAKAHLWFDWLNKAKAASNWVCSTAGLYIQNTRQTKYYDVLSYRKSRNFCFKWKMKFQL